MCRFTAYLGPPIRLASLLIEPEHSLIHQSLHATERKEPLNGDGFGIGWYAPEASPLPGVFRSVQPAWSNANLRSLSGVVSSGCIMAHVRAATQGMPVDESNCHPFQHGRLLFMHNGRLMGFKRVRRPLLDGLSDEAFNLVMGSTDTEHVFGLFVDEMAHGKESPTSLRMAEALNRTVWKIAELVDRHAPDTECVLNLAVSDGDTIVACRFAHGSSSPHESLYFIEREICEPVTKGSPARREGEDVRAFVVASERLTEDWAWSTVPPDHLVVVSRDDGCRWWAMTPDGVARPAGSPTPS